MTLFFPLKGKKHEWNGDNVGHHLQKEKACGVCFIMVLSQPTTPFSHSQMPFNNESKLPTSRIIEKSSPTLTNYDENHEFISKEHYLY